MLPHSLQPYAKAVYPSLLTLVAVVGQLVATGGFDRAELATAVTGALTALLAFSVPNTDMPVGGELDDRPLPSGASHVRKPTVKKKPATRKK